MTNWIVCPDCDGEGGHTVWIDEIKDTTVVPCNTCNGRTTVKNPEEVNTTDDKLFIKIEHRGKESWYSAHPDEDSVAKLFSTWADEVNVTDVWGEAWTFTIVKFPRCIDAHRGDCHGPVEYHSTPGRLKAFPRCENHWDERMERYDNSIERYANSATPPSWFDPADAGERWDDEY